MLQTKNESIFFENANPGYSFRPTNFAFIFVYKGDLELEINGFSSKYEFGNIIIMATNHLYKVLNFSNDLKVHILSCDKETIRQKTNFNFNKYDVYRLANVENNNNHLKFDYLEFKLIKNQFEQLAFYLNTTIDITFKNEIIWLLVNTIIYGVFGKLLNSFKKTSINNSRKENIVIQFIQLLSENFKTEKELKFYANNLNISIKYLSNCVREITKVPPKTFIAERLLNEAKIELLDKQKTINIISSNLGFSDQYAFGKFFKKHTGFSPKNYRLQNMLANSF